MKRRTKDALLHSIGLVDVFMSGWSAVDILNSKRRKETLPTIGEQMYMICGTVELCAEMKLVVGEFTAWRRSTLTAV